MSKYEDLLMEYEDKLLIEERNMKNEGLYGDNVAWINKNLPSRRKTCILAEEIGHYETSVGDILDQHSLDSAKQERAARGWAFNKLIPLDDIKAVSYTHLIPPREPAMIVAPSKIFEVLS